MTTFAAGEVWSAEAIEGLVRHNKRLLEENAKLRDLVRELWDVALHPETFGDGSYLLGRMRDLGIEVDGDTEYA